MEIESVEKLSEFMNYVENLPEDFCLSRGQNDKYNLLPSALRLDEKGNRKYTRASASSFLNDFKVNSHYYMPSPWDVKNDYDWMIYAQHYGLPTRLLDLTYSHIISLMFAVENSFIEKDTSDAAVWFLNPSKLNLNHCRRSEIITISSENVKEDMKLEDYDGPVVIQGRKLNERINMQNGLFVYFQDSAISLDCLKDNKDFLRKVVIKGDSKKDILTSLYSMGIGFTQVYPELSSVAKDILTKDSINMYLKERE